MGAINAVTDLAVEGEIAVLTVNSPPVNALSQHCLLYTSPSPRDS